MTALQFFLFRHVKQPVNSLLAEGGGEEIKYAVITEQQTKNIFFSRSLYHLLKNVSFSKCPTYFSAVWLRYKVCTMCCWVQGKQIKKMWGSIGQFEDVCIAWNHFVPCCWVATSKKELPSAIWCIHVECSHLNNNTGIRLPKKTLIF